MSRLVLPRAVALAGVVVVLAGCGGAGLQPCALYQPSTQAYLVLHPRGGTNAEVRRDCARIAAALSADASGLGGRLTAVKAKSDFGSDLLLCSVHGARGELDIYAKHRSGFAEALCSFMKTPSGKTTEVLAVTGPPHPPVYVVVSGPSAVTKFLVQRFLSLKGYVVVPKAHGQKACSVHSYASITIYSPSKNAAASFCRGLGKVFSSHK